MKPKRNLKTAFVSFLILTSIFSGVIILSLFFAEKANAQTVEQPTPNNEKTTWRDREGTSLRKEFLSAISENEKDWKSADVSNLRAGDHFAWELKKKKVEVFAREYDTVEQAQKHFADVRDNTGTWMVSVAVVPTFVSGIGDEALSRLNVTRRDSTIHLVFRKGTFIFSMDGEEKTLLRFAKHFLKVLESKSNQAK